MEKRTDLAVEARELAGVDISGVEFTQNNVCGLDISKLVVKNHQASLKLRKEQGTYITIDIKKLKIADVEEIQKASETVTEELRTLIEKHIDKNGDILIVGLGNAYVTPDSLRTKGSKRY